MANINFPASPAMGQEYPFGGFIYVWDGFKWTTKVQAVGTAYVQETAPPTTALPGSTWFCTANGMSYTLYTDADSTQWIESNPNHPVANSEITADAIGAVKKAGDFMTGALTVPSLLAIDSATAGPGIWLGGSTTTSQIVPLDSNASGDWSNGIGYTPTNGWHLIGAMGTIAQAIVRKDYVDSNFVNVTGDLMNGTLVNERISGDVDDYCAFMANVWAAGYSAMTTRRGPYHAYTSCDNVNYAPHSSFAYTNTTNGHSGKWSSGIIGNGLPNLDWAIHHIDNAGDNTMRWLFSISDGGSFRSPGPIFQNENQPVAVQADVDELRATVANLLSRIEVLEAT